MCYDTGLGVREVRTHDTLYTPHDRHPQGASIRHRIFLLRKVYLTQSASDSQPWLTLEPCDHTAPVSSPWSQSPAASLLGEADERISKASRVCFCPPELFDKAEQPMPPVPWGWGHPEGQA